MNCPFHASRIGDGPVIYPELSPSIGENINGPSVIKVPSWIDQPLGRYYIYFAHHQGKWIRLAYADRLSGPWKVHEAGVLHVDQVNGSGHVASPDVHVDHQSQSLRMYFHTCPAYPGQSPYPQYSQVAFSSDGLNFTPRDEILGPFYFRVFVYNDVYYALGKSDPDTTLLRSMDGISRFETGPRLLPRVRHTAVRVNGTQLQVFSSRIGDAPERIGLSCIDLERDWMDWKEDGFQTVLAPQYAYEGGDLPVAPSSIGASHEPVNQLRDPCVFEENGHLYLFYSVAGERGIALAELTGREVSEKD